jgi:hypothetical protein
MRDRRLLKARMIAYFLLSGFAGLGAPIWKRLLTGATGEWSGGSLAGYQIFLVIAGVFLWVALRAKTRLEAPDSN